MITIINSYNKIKYIIHSILTIVIIASVCYTQEVIGFSVGYESFPLTTLSEPIDPSDFKIGTSSFQFGAAFPMSFKSGKILLMNNLNYKKVTFNTENEPSTGINIKNAYSIEYSAFMIDSLSQKWSMVLSIAPGLASDFEGDISSDDLTLQVIFGYIKTYSEKLKMGYGLAYMRDFGTPIALPFIYVDWMINEKLKLNGIIPTGLDLAYTYNEKIDMGLSFSITGNRYHGDPDIHGVENPQMEYSEGTLSPRISYHILPQLLHLNLEGGYAFYRNFEFLDGDQTIDSYDLDPVAYFRMSLVLGM
jgi:hypothetical protein